MMEQRVASEAEAFQMKNILILCKLCLPDIYLNLAYSGTGERKEIKLTIIYPI